MRFLKSFNVPLLLLGGGGYTVRNVARCWAYETGVALEAKLPDEIPHNEFYEYYGPDFQLHITPSNMENQNTQSYLEEIRYVDVEPDCPWSRAQQRVLPCRCTGGSYSKPFAISHMHRVCNSNKCLVIGLSQKFALIQTSE